MSRLIDYWKDKFIGKNENSPAFRRQLAEKINGTALKYVSERKNNEEYVICHRGSISVNDDVLSVISNEKGTVFSSYVNELKMNELLSKEGIIFTGRDRENGGNERTVIAYYTYYRKVN